MWSAVKVRVCYLGAGLVLGTIFGAVLISRLSIAKPRTDPDAVRVLVREGFTPAIATSKPPPEIRTEYRWLPANTVVVATARADAPPTAKAAPTVWPCEVGTVAEPNWTLAPEHLGIEGWKCDFVRQGGLPFAKLQADAVALTPSGLVRRHVVPAPEQLTAWVDVQPPTRRVAGEIRLAWNGSAAVGLTVDGTGHWGGGVALRHDLDGGSTSVEGVARYLFHR